MSVRIGLVGVGGIAEFHLEHFAQLKEKVQLVGVTDVDAQRAAQFADKVEQQMGARPAVHTSPEALYDRERPDAVYVCVPPFAHGDIERGLIRKEIPFFVQKPVALNLDLALGVLDGVTRAGLITGVGYQLRYGQGLQRMRQLAAENTVGMALVIRLGGLPGVGWYPLQNRSGGQLVEMATHQVDMLRYVLGEVDRVYAAAATRVINRQDPNRDIFDVNCMSLTFSNGVVANFANNVISGGVVPRGLGGMHLLCENLTLSLTNGLHIIRPGAENEHVPDGDTGLACDEAFIDAIASGDGSRVRSPYVEGVRTLAVTLEAEASARSGEVRRLTPVLEKIATVSGDSAA